MIQGLTTNRAPRPTRIGVLRKGERKPAQGNRPGRDLDRFRFDPEAGDPALLEAFAAAYPDGNDIEVYLPYQTADENFEAWQEEWTASQLKHRCDGVHVYERDQRTGELHDTGRPCPGGCKQVGRLTVIVPALISGASRFGFVTVLTTSIYDIAELSQALAYYEMLAGGDLRGIPFVLSRREREVSVPMNGKRARVTKHLIFIEPSQRWVSNRLEAARRAALAAPPEVKLLVDSRTGEIHDAPADDVEEADYREVPPVPVGQPAVQDHQTRPMTPFQRQKLLELAEEYFEAVPDETENLLDDLFIEQVGRGISVATYNEAREVTAYLLREKRNRRPVEQPQPEPPAEQPQPNGDLSRAWQFWSSAVSQAKALGLTPEALDGAATYDEIKAATSNLSSRVAWFQRYKQLAGYGDELGVTPDEDEGAFLEVPLDALRQAAEVLARDIRAAVCEIHAHAETPLALPAEDAKIEVWVEVGRQLLYGHEPGEPVPF